MRENFYFRDFSYYFHSQSFSDLFWPLNSVFKIFKLVLGLDEGP